MHTKRAPSSTVACSRRSPPANGFPVWIGVGSNAQQRSTVLAWARSDFEQDLTWAAGAETLPCASEMKLHSQVLGSGPDLIILHGLFGSHQNWHPVARRLSGHFRVHTVDLRNHGSSPHDEDVNYPLMVDDLLAFMAQSGIERAHLLGHSLGGKVAMQFTLLHPQRTSTLVVVDIAPRAYESIQDEVFDALRGLHLSRIRTRTEADEALASAIPHHATRRFLLTNLVRSSQGAGFRWRVNLDALYAQREQLTAAVTGMVPFEGPTLFVIGANSTYVRDSDRVSIDRLFPMARLVTIPDAGHWVHVDSFEPFIDCVHRFLSTPFA